jgi:serine/threonine protein kinase
MEVFKLDRQDWVVSAAGERFLVGKKLGEGTFGRVHAVGDDKIMKIMRTASKSIEDNLIQEITIQQKLSEKEPGVCPKVYGFGKIEETSEYIIIMEKCEDTVHNLLNREPTDENFLDYYDQIATILGRLEPYEFNHRDLKADNVMYKTDPATGKRVFLLIDFGFSCATIDGVKYAGTLYFASAEKCFRRSRDLAQLVFQSYRYATNQTFKTFIQLVLTFTVLGKKCVMTNGCPPSFLARWADTYNFLNRDLVENPNTTPEGLRKAVASYRQGGIKACKDGFVVNPMTEECVPKPAPAAPGVYKPAISPHPHLASPVIREKTRRRNAKKSPKPKECSPGKVLNPKTRRCVKEKKKVCRAGKIIDPRTGRCVKPKS